MKLHEYLTNCKKRNNLSSQDVSELSGIPYNTVRRVLSGETQQPGIETVRAIAVAVGADLNMLSRLGVDDSEQPEPAAPEKAPPCGDCPGDSISTELLVSYRAALLRERHANKHLRILLLCVCLILFTLMAAVIVMFVYDYLNPNRGWIISWFKNVQNI